MRILIVAPYLPYPPHFGGASRMHYLMRHVSRHHAISLVCLCEPSEYNEEWVAAVKELCERMSLVFMEGTNRSLRRGMRRLMQLRATFSRRPYQYFSFHFPSLQKEIERMLAEDDYDIVQVEFPQMAYYQFPTRAKLVLSMHNVEHEIFYRTFITQNNPLRKFYNYVEWLKFRRDEIRLCAKFHALVTTSQRDADVFSKLLPNHLLSVVPNGVDTEYFRTSGTEPEPNTLIFTGTIGYYPNTDGICYFMDAILPRIRREVPDVKFLIVGNHPPEEIRRRASNGVMVTDAVPDVRPYYDRASVAIVPLRIGGGTRLKITEAMSMSKPVVSTSIGCEGIEVQHGETILIADDPEHFAQSVVSLLKQPERRVALGEKGRALACAKYDWHLSASRREEVYQWVTQTNRVVENSQGKMPRPPGKAAPAI